MSNVHAPCQAQRAAMHAAAAGKSTLGIPKSVGQEFVAADQGGKLPAKKKKPKVRIGNRTYESD